MVCALALKQALQVGPLLIKLAKDVHGTAAEMNKTIHTVRRRRDERWLFVGAEAQLSAS